MAFVNNFSTSFRWCDRLFGTDDKYREYRKRVDAMKRLGLSPDEYAAAERKLALEAEQDGLRAEAAVEAYSFGGKQKSD